MSLSDAVTREGLVTVAGLTGGDGYDWSEIEVYWHPASERFYWLSEGGCSCNWFGDYGDYPLSAFEDGDRDAAIRALTAWSGGGYHAASSDDVVRETAKVRDYTPEVTK